MLVTKSSSEIPKPSFLARLKGALTYVALVATTITAIAVAYKHLFPTANSNSPAVVQTNTNQENIPKVQADKNPESEEPQVDDSDPRAPLVKKGDVTPASPMRSRSDIDQTPVDPTKDLAVDHPGSIPQKGIQSDDDISVQVNGSKNDIKVEADKSLDNSCSGSGNACGPNSYVDNSRTVHNHFPTPQPEQRLTYQPRQQDVTQPTQVPIKYFEDYNPKPTEVNLDRMQHPRM